MASETNESDEPLILHCFADYGVESEILSRYGRVVRIGIDPHDANDSEPIRANAHIVDEDSSQLREWTDESTGESRTWDIPFADEPTFDLGVFHPVCTKWAETTSIDGDPDEHDNMIPSARSIAERYCEHYIIENVPRAPLKDPIVFDGRSFGLPIRFRRAFETNFDVPKPPQYDRFWIESETSSFYFTERSRMWWASVKGVPPRDYPKQHLAKNTIPAAYIQHLCRSWLKEYEEDNGIDYSNYDDKKEKERREDANRSLGDFGIRLDEE